MTWCNSGPRTRRQAGFSLMEVLIVLVVLGLAVALVASRGPVRSATMDLRMAGRELAGALRASRSRAMATGHPVLLSLDTATHAYRVDFGPWHELPAKLAITAVSSETAAGRRAGFRFAPDGSASGGRIDLALGARRVGIAVDWLTGRVSLADAP